MASFRCLFVRNVRDIRLNVSRVFVYMLASLSLPVADAQILTLTNPTMAPIPGAGHDYIHLLNETVNPANGSISVQVNLPMPKGRGLSLPFSFNYNSGQVFALDPVVTTQNILLELAYRSGVAWTTNQNLISSGGWSYGLPFATWAQWNGQVAAYQPPALTCPLTSGYTFTDPQGGTHSLGLGASGNSSTGSPPIPCSFSVTQAGDDQYNASLTNANGYGGPLTVSDKTSGTTYKFAGDTLFTAGPTSIGTSRGLLPYTIEDRNGNQINASQSVHSGVYSFSFTDTLNRTVISDPGVGISPEVIIAGGQQYTVTWKNTNANYSVPVTPALTDSGVYCGGVSSVSNTAVHVISMISLPNGQAYHFYYGDDNPNGLGNPYGLISEIDYPDGAWVRYTWKTSDTYSDLATYPAGENQNPSTTSESGTVTLIPDGCQYHYSAPVLATRMVSPSGNVPASSQAFTYSTTWHPTYKTQWSSKTTSVTTTDQILKKNFLKQYVYTPGFAPLPPYTQSSVNPQIALEQSVATYDWGNTSTPLEVQTKAWYDQYEVACEFDTVNGMVSSGHFYQYGPGAQVSDDQEYDLGQVPNPASACTGFGTNTSLGPVPTAPTNTTPARETSTAFQTFTNPLGTMFVSPQSVIVYGNGSKAAETDFGYDGGGTASVSAVQHDESNFSSSVVAGRGNLTSITRKCLGCTDAATSYAYDETGQVVSSTDACGNTGCNDVSGSNHTVTYAYTDSPASSNGNTNAYVTQVVNALGQSQNFTYNYGTGGLATAKDANGQTTKYIYSDPLNRLTQTQYPDGGLTSTTYNDSVPSVSTAVTIGPSVTEVSTKVLDGMGHVIQTQLSSDPAGTDYVDMAYDGSGQLFSVSNPHRSGSLLTDGSTTYTYDALGRKTLQSQADGTTQSWAFSGNATTSKDEAGNQRTQYADGLGRLTDVYEGPGSKNLHTQYKYDGINNLLSVLQVGLPGSTPGGFPASYTETSKSRTFSYDSLSRLVTAFNPESGWTCYGNIPSGQLPNASNCASGYDANGNLRYKTDANGMTISYQYDALNRLFHKWAPDADNLDGWFQYDGGPNGIGRLTAEWRNAVAGEGYMYDPMGRVVSTNWINYAAGNSSQPGMQIQYDLAGNATQLIYPDGRVVNQAWNSAGRLNSVSDATPGGSNQAYATNIQYWPAGALQSSVYGNGVSQNVNLNQRLQPCRATASSPLFAGNPNGGNFLDRQSFFNPSASSPCGNEAGNNGNIYDIVDHLQHGASQSFAYDGLNRLTSAASSGGFYNHTYNYDSFGNMLLQDNLHTNLNYGIDSSTNRLLLNNTDYGYDNAGNLTQVPGHTFLYTAEHYLRCVDGCQIGSYLIDAAGQRTFAVHGNTWNEYVYLNGQPMADLNPQGVWTDYIYANGQKIAKTTSAELTFHMHGVRDSRTQNMGCGVGPVIPGLSEAVINQTIAQGDKLAFDVRQSDTGSSLASGFGFGFQSGYVVNYFGTGGITDQNGNYPATFSISDNAWHHSISDLSSLAGQVISDVKAGIQGEPWTGFGTWDVWIANAVLVRADGETLPIFTGQQTSWNIPSTCGGNQQTFQTELAAASNASMSDSDVNTSYYVNDYLGTTQMEFAGGGWPIWQGQFTPFGQEIIGGTTTNYIGPQPADGASTRYKFTGKERDTESGLDYFGARYYASSMGRWISPDWAAKAEPVPYAKLDNPQSLNLYAYVLNNPLSKADLDGHCPQCVEQVFEYLGETPAGEEISAGAVAGWGALSGAVGAAGAYLSNQLSNINMGDISQAYANGAGGSASWAPMSVMQKGAAQAPDSAASGAANLGPKAATAAGVTAGGQATDEHGNKLGPSRKPQVNKTQSNTREGANDKAKNDGSGSVEHSNPKEGKPHFHPTDAQGNKQPISTHHEYPE